jgi:para-aminobenzoate synthetase/4-amino-4-deoxychorismate lyase
VTDALSRLAARHVRVTREVLGSGPDPEQLVYALRDEPGLVCLQGEWAGGGALLTFDPVLVLASGSDAFAALATVPVLDEADHDAIGGGWFGWLAYDGEHRLAFYDNVLRLVDGTWSVESLEGPDSGERVQAFVARCRQVVAGARDDIPSPAVGAFSGADRDEHLAAVERAIAEIRAGEIYQANICTRLSAELHGPPSALYAALMRLRPVYGSLVTGDGRTVVGAGPELFLRRRGRTVVTAPIKGTRPRASATADELRRSVKDVAENVMIVDLMRNDLGRVCVTGTVAADRLLDVEAHPGVWHLVSRVRGTLREGVDDGALLRATFPPGSVTGAPKLRAMQVIDAVERGPRGVYTGAVGFSSPSWGAEFAVAIRAFEVSGDRVELGVGGGITADSVPMLEWQECLHKAAPLLDALGAEFGPAVARMSEAPSRELIAPGLLETVLVLDGRPLRLGEHLARLDRSCRELYGLGVPEAVEPQARAAAATAPAGRAALRLVVAPGVDTLIATVSCRPAPAAPVATAAVISVRPGGSWRHKWADRRSLTAAEESVAPGVPLFLDPRGNVLETSRGNVFLVGEDGLVTPPLGEGLLPGVTRAAVLDLARDAGRPVQLRPITLEELRSTAAFWTSSLSGAVAVTHVDGHELPRRDDLISLITKQLLGGGHPIR